MHEDSGRWISTGAALVALAAALVTVFADHVSRGRQALVALAGFFALRQSNYKRLLAYSLIEHMGMVSLGLGIGGPIAAYGAFFHVLVHAAGKHSRFASGIAAPRRLKRSSNQDLGPAVPYAYAPWA